MKQQRRWQFKPPLWAWFLMPIVAAGLFSLSVWQLDRAETKRERLAQFEQGRGPTEIQDMSALAELARYESVRLTGRYLAHRQFRLEDRHRDGRLGYHVWSVLRLRDSGGLVVVDRGWRPRGESVPAPPGGTQTVTGRIDRLPRPGLELDTPAPEGAWPRSVYFPDRALLADQLGEPVFDGRILLDPDAPNGFDRAWQLVNLPPERHLGYAVQWAALGLAVIIIFFVVNTRRVRNHDQ